MRIEQAVIFAGGSGVRLRPLTDSIPKPLAPVNGIPFLDYLFQSIADVGIRKILMLVGYKHEKIVKRYGDCLPNGIRIEYSVGSVDDQTGRRLLNGYRSLDDKFLLMYGDNYWPISLDAMLRLHGRMSRPLLTTVFDNKSGTAEYGFENNVAVGESSVVSCYDKSRKTPGLNGVDIGYFIVDKENLGSALDGRINQSFEEDIFRNLVSRGDVVAFMTDVQYYYITDIGSLSRFEEYVTFNKVKHIGMP